MRPPTFLPLPSLAQASWLRSPETQAVLAALANAGHDARIVGGAVRNALMDRPVKDIDIATTAAPAAIIDAARNAGLRAIETGIEHGTITVVSAHTPFEVTTLRRDVETDGRRARVEFTADWAEDARRRDFTINALYCNANGKIFDPLGGYEDLVHRRVVFIGSAEDRIREDYLRILRFFRFTAECTNGPPDLAGLQACLALKSGISQLSGERRRMELLRILATTRAPAIAAVMAETGVLRIALGLDGDVAMLARVANIEDAAGILPDPVLRLGAIGLTKPSAAIALRDSLKLPSIQDERLSRMALPDRSFDPSASEIEAKAFVYRHGPQFFRDGVILTWARTAADTHDLDWLDRLNLTQRWQAPELPVRGTDVLALGIASGPEVGRILSAFEDWWIASDFPMTHALLAKRLQQTITVTKS